jgi:hypothetical protein
MTVSTSYAPLSFNGDDATTAFAVTWPFFDSSLVVTLVDSTGVETVKTITTHYTVSGGTDSDGLPATGTVTMLTAPASGETLRITRNTSKVQSSSWTNGGAYQAKTLEATLDKIILIAQETQAGINDDITGDVMQLNTSGATDYWDAEDKIIRNVIDAVEDDDAVNKSQLDAAVLGDSYFTQAGTGAVTRTWLSKMREPVSVRDFGAVGDGVTDDTDAFQAAADHLATVGGKLRIPSGKYLITNTVSFDYAAAALGATRGISIEGDGSGNTAILSNHSGAAFSLSKAASLGSAYSTVRGLQIYQSGASGRTGTAILIDNIAFMVFEDMLFYNTNYGVRATDFLVASFVDCVFRLANYGAYMEGTGGLSPPNDITFSRCKFNSNYEYGAKINGGRLPRFLDCVFEENGKSGVGAERCSIKVSSPDGPIALSVVRAYVTHNAGDADFWVDMGASPAVVIARDCQFTRISNTQYVNNMIRIDQGGADGHFKLVVEGCTFSKLNTYVASASRPYISLTDGAGGAAAGTYDVFIPDGSNYFGDASEAPSEISLVGSGRFNNEGLRVLDTDASHDQIIKVGSNLSADRTLTITTGDADRTLTIGASATVSQDYSSSGSPTFTNVRVSNGIRINDTDDSHYAEIVLGSDLTSNRTLTVDTGDADRSLVIGANTYVSQDYRSTASPQFAGINLGHATDTTLTRSAAGVPSVEGRVLWQLVAAYGAASSHTGDTNETVLATISLPGGLMGPNGVVRVTSLWSYTNSGNNKTMRTRLGGIAGTSHATTVTTATASARVQCQINNRNSQSSQVSAPAGFGSGVMFGVSGGALTTGTIDTSTSQDIVLTAALANSGETITLESYIVEVAYAA